MFQKWCEMTTCNGIIDLYEAKGSRLRTGFWSVVMVTMFFCSIWFTYRTALGYIQTSTVTNVETETKSSLELPEVLITYNGGLNVSAMKEANFSDRFIHTFSNSFNIYAHAVQNRTSLKHELKLFMDKHNYSYVDVAKKFGYNCEDLVHSITEPDASVSICESKEDFLTDRGNSYIFRSKSFQWYPGLWGGWRFILKAPKNSYVKFYPDRSLALDMNEEFSITMEKSFGHFLSRRSFIIPLDSKVEITLNTKLYKRINGSRTCGAEHTTSNSCFYYCWMEEFLRCLQCIPFIGYGDGGKYNQSQVCNPFDMNQDCLDSKNGQKCGEKCLPLCDEWLYEPTIVYSSLASLSMNVSVSNVVIGYSTMQYTKVRINYDLSSKVKKKKHPFQIEEVKAFTIDMAISNVGGQAGLWLGVSVVTIIQAFYYFVLGIFKKSDVTHLASKNNGLQQISFVSSTMSK